MTGPGARPSSPRPRGRRRVIVARTCIAADFALLLLLVIFPAHARHLYGGGWLTVACAAVSIVTGLAYLRSRKGRP